MISSKIILVGQNSVLERDESAPAFRFFHVSQNGDLEIRLLTLQGGDSGPDSSGGGIYSLGMLTLSSVHMRNNVSARHGGAIMSGSGGGAIDGRLGILSSAITHNHAAEDGGGLFTDTENNDSNAAKIVNSTFSHNSSDNRGGGIFNFDGQAELETVTITNNEAADGSGVASFGDTFTKTIVSQSIIANNLDDDVAFVENSTDSFESGGNNIIGSGNATSNFLAANNDIINVADARLKPLADNGGNTPSHMPRIDSPAVEHSNQCGDSVFQFDQRGTLRPLDGNGDQDGGASTRCDAGAIERDNTILVDIDETLVANNGQCSLREAIINANASGGAIHDDCRGGQSNGGTDIIALPERNVFTYTQSFENDENALPLITSRMIIEGNGSVIERDQDSVRSFRLLETESNGHLTLERSTIRGGRFNFAGGISNVGYLRLKQSTISGNTAFFSGGGIYNAEAGILRLEQSTVSGNGALSSGVGGGIHIHSDNGIVMLFQSTVSGNFVLEDGTGDGISIFGGKVLLQQSLISGNGDATSQNSDIIEISDSVISQGNNLIGVSNATFSEPGDVVIDQAAPRLGPLRFNGGFTRTMKPRPDSPALTGFEGDCDSRIDQRDAQNFCDKGSVNVGSPFNDEDSDGLRDEVDGEQTTNSNVCTGMNATLPNQTVPRNTLVQCGAELSIDVGLSAGNVTVSSDGELQLFAPEVSVPVGHVLRVEKGAVFSVESIDPSPFEP